MDQQPTSALIMALRAFRFAADHPYAATGIFGAAVGSVATYKVLTLTSNDRPNFSRIITPKVYELALTPDDLQKMLLDPKMEIRVEAPEMTVVVTSERREPLKELPVVEGSSRENHGI